MEKYLKNIARKVLSEEISEKNELLKESLETIGTLSRDLNLAKKKISSMTEDYEIILKDFRIDNIGPDGIPPSYLPSDDEKAYRAKIEELDQVYSNGTFRELLGYLVNFHANLAVTGKIRNANGDMVDVTTEHVQHMVRGIKSVWELIVGARHRKKQLDSGDKFNPYDILSMPEEEGSL